MASQEPSLDYAWPPAVVGFDMPSTSAHASEGAAPVMVAFLSARPDHYWIETFVAEAGAFIARHGLADVRMDAQCLVVMGAASQLRNLTADLRSFVHHVSRLSLQRRIIDRATTDDISASMAAENAAAQRDLELVAHVPNLATILSAVARETGMRLIAVARVSDTRWTACAVHDTINFGLQAGQDLVLETTICNEIRKHGQSVMFNHASNHPVFSRHRTPALYGFESYISVPIFRNDGQFFGTLCAVDPDPRRLDPSAVQTVERFARLIGEAIEGD